MGRNMVLDLSSGNFNITSSHIEDKTKFTHKLPIVIPCKKEEKKNTIILQLIIMKYFEDPQSG
jgi:hypothetical protein